MLDNPYFRLTIEFNHGALRVVLSSGQAVVHHRLAIMSKDGDWIVREEPSALQHVLAVLESHGASYRFGAPLDVRWLRGGWSSHFEFVEDGMRLRTDFVSRPPRLDVLALEELWVRASRQEFPVIDLVPLARLKLTDREKDYAVVGELARRMPNPADRIRFSRSARDLLAMAASDPELVRELARQRPVLHAVAEGRERLEEALDRERRELMRANEQRLERYRRAATVWSKTWSRVARRIDGVPLREAHAIVVAEAEAALPEEASA